MVAISTWFRYLTAKLDYSVSVARMAFLNGRIGENQVFEVIKSSFLYGRVTITHWDKGGEGMRSIFGVKGGGTLLIRRFPNPDTRKIRVGDVVLVTDPNCKEKCLVRRLAAVAGHEMLSTNRYDDPFLIPKGHCWVLVDNYKMNPEDAYDSRTFGPVMMKEISGRPIYCLRSPVDHEPVRNSLLSESKDAAILEVELDIEEMANSLKT